MELKKLADAQAEEKKRLDEIAERERIEAEETEKRLAEIAARERIAAFEAKQKREEAKKLQQ